MTLLGYTTRTLCYLLAVWLLTMPLVSCNHKDLLNIGDSQQLDILFDWSGVPDATPQQMRLVVFKSASQPLELPFSPQGGTTSLTGGSYDFIAYNSESEVLSASGNTYEDFQIASLPTTLAHFSPEMFASQRAPRAEGTEEQKMVYSPDELWTSVRSLDFFHDIQTITFPMQAATIEYVFVINNVQNLGTVSELTATISGMSESWIPSLGRCSDTHCIMPFTVTTDGQSTITARVRCFGHCPDDDHSEHILMIYAMLADQTKWYYQFNITQALHDANHHDAGGEGIAPEVPIVLDDLPLPAPVPAEGMGLTPQVDTWQEITIEHTL